jgi:hypothetical protein
MGAADMLADAAMANELVISRARADIAPLLRFARAVRRDAV